MWAICQGTVCIKYVETATLHSTRVQVLSNANISKLIMMFLFCEGFIIISKLWAEAMCILNVQYIHILVEIIQKCTKILNRIWITILMLWRMCTELQR